MTPAVRVGIHGACGRMGQRLVALGSADKELRIVAALDAASHPWQGRDAGEVAGVSAIGAKITSELPNDHVVESIIDFSAPEGTMHILKTCVERKIPLVIATTGFEPHHREAIRDASNQTAILISANMSLVVNVLFKLVADTAKLLAGKGFDVEIVERHHRHKKDSPSGTAMHFAKSIQAEMGQKRIVHGRDGLVGERPLDEIGMHAVRAGDNVGEHTIIFSAPGETLELVHKGSNRDSYAMGALLAAKFLANKPAGMYDMKDVLGL